MVKAVAVGETVIIPGWVPAWVMRILDFLFFGESTPAAQCERCGAIIDKESWMTDDQFIAQIDAHDRFFHPEHGGKV